MVQLTLIETSTELREADLQCAFMQWNTPADAHALIAGRPRLLAPYGTPISEHSHATWGSRSRADIVVDVDPHRKLVIELKLASKYEPLGLTEVLFHAACLAHHHPDQEIRPVLVTQYNFWNRIAIDSLHRQTRQSLVDYYEVTVMKIGDKPCFWFDAPLAPWQRRAHPPEPVAQIAAQARMEIQGVAELVSLTDTLYWYEVPEVRSYIALGHAMADRPAILEDPYLMITPLDERWLAWVGVPPRRDATSQAWLAERAWLATL